MIKILPNVQALKNNDQQRWLTGAIFVFSFSLSLVKNQKISRDTLIWQDGGVVWYDNREVIKTIITKVLHKLYLGNGIFYYIERDPLFRVVAISFFFHNRMIASFVQFAEHGIFGPDLQCSTYSFSSAVESSL